MTYSDSAILDMLVQREVMCNMTGEIEFMLKMYWGNSSDDDNPITEYFNSDYSMYDIYLTKDDKILEWWAVSKWFGEKLKEKGCVVFDAYGKSYWGRETSGQCISMDGVVYDIAKDMKILNGMEYDWSKQ